MKLEIQANDFCPDNCPHCEPYKTKVEKYNYVEKYYAPRVEWRCKNRERCKILAKAIKGDEKENET